MAVLISGASRLPFGATLDLVSKNFAGRLPGRAILVADGLGCFHPVNQHASHGVDDYRRMARKSLPRFVFDYVDGGADREDCLARNTSDLQNARLLPTCLRDTRSVDTSIEVFGCRWKGPIGIAPTGFNGLIRPNGDVLLAKAAARAAIPFVLSTASNARLEAVRAATPAGINWLQLYVMKDRAIAEHLVRRARNEGFGALVLTVDVPTNGNRRRDVRTSVQHIDRKHLMMETVFA